MKFDEAKMLASQCVKAAKEAWYANFENTYHSGDLNREAVGRIANTLLERCLGSEGVERPSKTE